GQYYLCDVIGATVYNEEDDSVIGEVKDVIETGANNVFAIGLPDGREVLFPVIDDCIKEVNTEECRVVAHIMKGLMDE
ncbi:MAG: ribosome maturation factor RimM, partial [Eubacterium sp.]